MSKRGPAGQPEESDVEWVVQDANILIDLFEAELFQGCIDPLHLSILVPDLVAAEITSHREQLNRAIQRRHISIVELTPSDLILVAERQAQQRTLSIQDYAAWLIAEQRRCTLLTGDRRLRKAAEKSKVEVHGLLWVMKRLADVGWDRADLHNKLSLILEKGKSRLPAMESRALLADWTKPS